jgi:hypothetical protein
MMRGGLISMLYGKATEVGLTDVDTASSLTLMSADIERIVTGMETGHEVRDMLPVINQCRERTCSLHISYANFLACPGIVPLERLSQSDLNLSDHR